MTHGIFKKLLRVAYRQSYREVLGPVRSQLGRAHESLACKNQQQKRQTRNSRSRRNIRSLLCPLKGQVRKEEKLGIQNKRTKGTRLSKVKIFDVEFEVHFVSLCDARSQPISGVLALNWR